MRVPYGFGMSADANNDTVDFGYARVPRREKAARVKRVFDSVAPRYDLMNDVMSFGLHRLWKRFAVALCHVRAGEHVLDAAGGSGDIARLIAPRLGDTGSLALADINAAMLRRGRARLLDSGVGAVAYVQADVELLPFPDNSFDVVTIAFGLRNVTRKQDALRAMYRCLRPGGRLVVLEFSKPTVGGLPGKACNKLYDLYSFAVLPRLGEWLAADAASYRYLAESIRMHPDQAALKGMLEAAGFARCQVYNLAGGIVAAHRGYRL